MIPRFTIQSVPWYVTEDLFVLFQGEEEAMFQEYRKELKIIFNNLTQLVSAVSFSVYRFKKIWYRKSLENHSPFADNFSVVQSDSVHQMTYTRDFLLMILHTICGA